MIFRKKGLRIEISPLFFIITSTLLLIDDSGYMAYSLLFSLCHEFGHLLMMYLLKKPPHYISVKYYGLEICASSFNYLEAILISLSGPFINVLFAILFSVASRFLKIDFLLIIINLAIGIFNLLPIESLDGGDILSALLSLLFNDRISKLITKIVSVLSSSIIFIFGVMLIQYGNIGVILIGIYLFVINLIKSD